MNKTITNTEAFYEKLNNYIAMSFRKQRLKFLTEMNIEIVEFLEQASIADMADNEIGGIYAITVKHHENHWIVMRTSYTESMEKHLEERYGKECKERLFAYLTFISDVMEKSDQNWEQKLFSAKNADKTAILNAEMIGKTIVGVKQVGNIVKITLENGQEYIF